MPAPQWSLSDHCRTYCYASHPALLGCGLWRRNGRLPHTLIIARSEAHQAHFIAVPKELLSHVNTVTGERPSDLARAEIVYFETTNGGAVFSTGSITFLGSLWRPGRDKAGYDNPVTTMLGNVVRRFAHN